MDYILHHRYGRKNESFSAPVAVLKIREVQEAFYQHGIEQMKGNYGEKQDILEK